MKTLEDKLIEDLLSGIEVPLERALLIFAGCNTEELIREYTAKITNIHQQFREHDKKRPLTNRLWNRDPLPKRLHDFLWQSNPNRYAENKDGGHYLLTDVIEAQLGGDQSKPVNNCAGADSIYAVLVVREKWRVEFAQDRRHCALRVSKKKRRYYVDPSERDGFNMRGIKELTPIIDRAFFSRIITNRAVTKYDSGNYQDAIEDTNKALALNQFSSVAYNTRGNCRRALGDLGGATADYTRAIILQSDCAEYYCNRGGLFAEQKLYLKAFDDFVKAYSIDPSITYARNALAELTPIVCRMCNNKKE